MAFDKIKDYLLNPPILMLPQPRRPLIMYLFVLDEAVQCVLGRHDESGKNEQVIYYLSKKFTVYEANYSFSETSCYALAWAAQKLRHYLMNHTTYLISRSDLLKYLLEKPMPIDAWPNGKSSFLSLTLFSLHRRQSKGKP